MKDFFLNYFLILWIITFVITVYDKIASKKFTKHRVRESYLFLLAVFGGALPEYLTMLLIRHKTKHKKFMIGLPVIFVLQLISAGIIIYFNAR